MELTKSGHTDEWPSFMTVARTQGTGAGSWDEAKDTIEGMEVNIGGLSIEGKISELQKSK